MTVVTGREAWLPAVDRLLLPCSSPTGTDRQFSRCWLNRLFGRGETGLVVSKFNPSEGESSGTGLPLRTAVQYQGVTGRRKTSTSLTTQTCRHLGTGLARGGDRLDRRMLEKRLDLFSGAVFRGCSRWSLPGQDPSQIHDQERKNIQLKISTSSKFEIPFFSPFTLPHGKCADAA